MSKVGNYGLIVLTSIYPSSKEYLIGIVSPSLVSLEMKYAVTL